MREEIARVLIEHIRRDNRGWSQLGFESVNGFDQMNPNAQRFVLELSDRLIGAITSEIIDAQKAARRVPTP